MEINVKSGTLSGILGYETIDEVLEKGSEQEKGMLATAIMLNNTDPLEKAIAALIGHLLGVKKPSQVLEHIASLNDEDLERATMGFMNIQILLPQRRK